MLSKVRLGGIVQDEDSLANNERCSFSPFYGIKGWDAPVTLSRQKGSLSLEPKLAQGSIYTEARNLKQAMILTVTTALTFPLYLHDRRRSTKDEPLLSLATLRLDMSTII